MEKLGDFMQQNYMTMRWLFQDHIQEDGAGGAVDRREVMRLLRHCMPGLSPTELRHLRAELREMDTEGDGQVCNQSPGGPTPIMVCGGTRAP